MTNLITPPRVESAVVSLEEMLRRQKAMEDALRREAASSPDEEAVVPVVSPAAPLSDAFSIAARDGMYQLQNVSHHGKLYNFYWSNCLLNGSTSPCLTPHRQRTWLANEEFRTSSNVMFNIPSGPEYASTILALYRHREVADVTQRSLLEQFKSALESDLRDEPRMMTRSCVKYTPNALVEVFHAPENKGTSRSLSLPDKSGPVDIAWLSEPYSLFDVDNPIEFLAAIHWLLGTSEVYLLRAKTKLWSFHRVMSLSASSSTFVIDIQHDDPCYARGILVSTFGDAP